MKAAAADDDDDDAFELRAGALRLALRPALGGSVAGLWHGDAPILRSSEPRALESSRQAAMFPLVPYSNRLGYRRFRWHGRDHTTEANFHGSPHSLHGIGWQRPWRLVQSSALEVALELVHRGDAGWPFAFTARQFFSLAPNAFAARLQVTNDETDAQPVGLGWHPYFVRRARSRLHVELAARWERDPTLLPTRRVAQPGIDADLAHLDFDHNFDGWRGAARLRDERFSLRLTSSLERLVVFTPPGRDYFCVEPVSHVANAIHMADPIAQGLVALAPGATLEAWMTLAIDVV